jgi:hypothetical protein
VADQICELVTAVDHVSAIADLSFGQPLNVNPATLPPSANTLRSFYFPGFPRLWVIFLTVFSLLARGPLTHSLREKSQQGEDSMSQPVGPTCSSEYVKRVSRLGPERLISLFYIYPFSCQPCGHRFRLLQWGVTYTKIEVDQHVERKAAPKARIVAYLRG